MREIRTDEIINATAKGFIDANIYLPETLKQRISVCKAGETGVVAGKMFTMMEENILAAEEKRIPVCQDCGMAVVFAEVGQEVHIVGGDFETAIHQGVSKGYTEGYLRKSVVKDPFRRENTGDNTPAVIHTKIVSGDKLKLTFAPKGFGSENMSTVRMFNPTATKEEMMDFVVQTVLTADARPCPPLVVGIGIGGDFEYCALLAKKALCRDVTVSNADEFYAAMEKELTERINALKIGPQGFGGDCTALNVAIETYPTHIAGLPCAVNIGCHVTRHITVTL